MMEFITYRMGMQPTFFINHGGGPCFFLQPGPMREVWKPLEAYLAGFASALSEPPAAHLAIGRALKPLREQGLLIIGSGQTYHNMRGFGGSGTDLKAEDFDAWLRRAITITDSREQSLIDWERAPGARHAQPHEDHLLPLMVAAGAASGETAVVDFHGVALGKPISGFRFG